MNSRRLSSNMGLPPRRVGATKITTAANGTLGLPSAGGQVPGQTLFVLSPGEALPASLL
jgi:hypothetical protein